MRSARALDQDQDLEVDQEVEVVQDQDLAVDQEVEVVLDQDLAVDQEMDLVSGEPVKKVSLGIWKHAHALLKFNAQFIVQVDMPLTLEKAAVVFTSQL
jgi:hypothetical protein